jgi:hypothetical protein
MLPQGSHPRGAIARQGDETRPANVLRSLRLSESLVQAKLNLSLTDLI